MNTLSPWFVGGVRIALFTIAFVLAVRSAEADPQTVLVGGTTISLPSPEGFFRFDGKSAVVDKYTQRSVAPENRLLAMFGSEENLADALIDKIPEIDRTFSSQTVRSLEPLAITRALFAGLKPEIRKAFAAATNMDPNIVEDAERILHLKIGEAVNLGVFEETADSVCFSMLMKVEDTGGRVGPLTIIAACFVRVRDRVLMLYATSQYREKTDITQIRQSLQRWRDAVVSANPQ